MQSPEAARGWTCNLTPVGRSAEAGGGWKVWRYVDRGGHECAFYDTSPAHPLAVGTIGLPGTGVAVLDMSDPARPVRTALLTDLPMQAPHESLHLHAGRGLLAAEVGSGLTAPGLLSIYDVGEDCRHPVRKSTTLAARFGHESGWSPDGQTYWLSGGVGLAAIDVSDPSKPRNIWEGAIYAHGLSVSADGNRLYVADPISGHLVILDSSEVQARKPDPEVREISRLTWKTVSIPQNTAPLTIAGKPYLLEFDEFAFRFTAVPQDLNQVGAARIIDISDERHPRVVSNLRLSVNQRDRHMATASDPGAASPVQGYAAHYCAVPREVDPQIVACSFIGSGLRVFDIRDPASPREIAYYVAPPAGGAVNVGTPSNFAMSKPAFVPERREVWYTDIVSGLHVVRLDERAWPNPVSSPCVPRRSVVVTLKGRPSLRRLRVAVNGRRASARRMRGGALRVRVPRGVRGSTLVVRVSATTRRGRRVRATRRYRSCVVGPALARTAVRASDRVVPRRFAAADAAGVEMARRIDLVCDLNAWRKAAS